MNVFLGGGSKGGGSRDRKVSGSVSLLVYLNHLHPWIRLQKYL